jgi:hypothetical protein
MDASVSEIIEPFRVYVRIRPLADTKVQSNYLHRVDNQTVTIRNSI